MTTLYFVKGIDFIIRAFGLNVRWQTRCKIKDNGELECLVIVYSDNKADTKKVVELFETMTILRKQEFSSDIDIAKRID